MSNEKIVEIRKLSKTIGNKQIIKNLNLDLHKGEITGFLGPNGAGKTTTIRMMVGLMKPTSGDILISGNRFAPALRIASKKWASSSKIRKCTNT